MYLEILIILLLKESNPFWKIVENLRSRRWNLWERRGEKFWPRPLEELPGTYAVRFRANLGNAYIRTRTGWCMGAD